MIALRVDVRAGGDERRGSVRSVVPRREVQRRPTIILLRVDVGAGSDERRGSVRSVAPRRDVQRRPPMIALRVDVGAGGKQHGRNLLGIRHRRHVQWSGTSMWRFRRKNLDPESLQGAYQPFAHRLFVVSVICQPRVGICSRLQQRFGEGGQVHGRRIMQIGPAVLVGSGWRRLPPQNVAKLADVEIGQGCLRDHRGHIVRRQADALAPNVKRQLRGCAGVAVPDLRKRPVRLFQERAALIRAVRPPCRLYQRPGFDPQPPRIVGESGARQQGDQNERACQSHQASVSS